MKLLDRILGRTSRRKTRRVPLFSSSSAARASVVPCLEALEDRFLPDATGALNLGILTITSTPNTIDRVALTNNGTNLVLTDNGITRGTFTSAAVNSIVINANSLYDTVRLFGVTQQATFNGGSGTNFFYGDGGPSTMNAGSGTNRLIGGSGNDELNANQGVNVLFGGLGQNQYFGAGAERNYYFGSELHDIIGTSNPPPIDEDLVSTLTDPPNLSASLGLAPTPDELPANQLTTSDVQTLLERASAATANDSAIVVVVDRDGNILGVRVEGDVSPIITDDQANLIFAIDGAVAEARTGAFFGNDQAPLTSRTIQFISQTTITQQMIDSNPSITDINDPLYGPGTVGPQGIGAEFPPNVANTPQVDLFGIEETNRDSTNQPIFNADGSITFSPTPTGQRFNANPAYIPANILTAGEQLQPPDSYGFASGLNADAIPRGIGTLPGGLPIYKNGVEVGGIGIFYPGTTGFANEENSALSNTYDPSKPDLSEEAEYAAFAALGGVNGFQVGTLGGVALPSNLSAVPPGTNLSIPAGSVDARIDLVGITLPIFGPGGVDGPQNLFTFGQTLGLGDPNSGVNEPLLVRNAQNVPMQGGPDALGNVLPGIPVPSGWLVLPHAGPSGLTASEVTQMIEQGIQQALQTRAAIRLPLDSNAEQVFAVTDTDTGEVLGLFRMPDSTIFSLDVAVAKARNVGYYDNASQLQAIDETPGVAPGVAFTNRTFRYLANPRFPEGSNSSDPGPFSILNDGHVDPTTGQEVGGPLPVADFISAFGHNAFFPDTNFHDPYNTANQDGIVFFPGSSAVYLRNTIAGGLGVSGDGVDEDDVITAASANGFGAPPTITTADEVFVRGVRLPYMKFNRDPDLPNPNPAK